MCSELYDEATSTCDHTSCNIFHIFDPLFASFQIIFLQTMATGGGVLPPEEETGMQTMGQVDQVKDKEKQEKKVA